jgi:hypothetical protein
MDQTQDRRKKAYIMKEEINTEEIVILEVLLELIDIIDLLNQQENFMDMKTP